VQLDTRRGRFEVIDGGTGTPVVLVHGFPFSAESWRADAEALAGDMGVRVIAPSMRGFGKSEASGLDSLSMDVMADDVAAILDALALDAVVVGGLSMGGYVTLSFARRFPERLRGLVLADTRAEPDTDEGRANRDRGIARVESGDYAGYVDSLLEVILAPSTRSSRPAVVEQVRRMAMQARPASVVAALRAMRDRADSRPVLGSIAVPTLVVVGADDALIPPPASRAIVAALPPGLATEHVIPSAGHLSNLERPEDFQPVLGAFVRGLGAER
jgi:pimeloyl-ACP methyl ester carboxylesterase